ncbi:MAG: tRNA pseudouridine(55) synthase TruB [Candidatus Coatesbacteria bacterium]|nr:MAG: tRNA pseudouridine(55) synthase TruB [Candidatus Coatesbacteria bacterium]
MAGGRGIEGALLVNKPSGPTSHDVVDGVRRALGIKRVGHVGTLDPFADGLLVLLVGRATRLAEYLTGYDKAYRATLRLGATTDTEDCTGTLVEEKAVPDLSVEGIEGVFARFEGRIRQRVPAYSAVKVDGERLYRRVRRGADVDTPVREIEIYSLTLVEYDSPEITFDVECSTGTYVRALARDIGEALGCGAHLVALTRTRVGLYELADAVSLDKLKADGVDACLADKAFVPAAEMLPDFPTVGISEEDASNIGNGRDVTRTNIAKDAGDGAMVKLVLEGRLAAVGRITGDSVRPVKVFIS